jgi:hypothetical protein
MESFTLPIMTPEELVAKINLMCWENELNISEK